MIRRPSSARRVWEYLVRRRQVLDWDKDGRPGRWIDKDGHYHCTKEWYLSLPRVRNQHRAFDRLRRNIQEGNVMWTNRDD